MSSVCLNVNITYELVKLKINISEVCGVAYNYVPLFVDEGLLFIDLKNDKVSNLFVKKK